MTLSVLDETRALLDAAAAEYRDDEDAQRHLRAHADRLAEPLRVAIAGMVKAGKSTLLNAIIGEEIAPTDAGECTKVITWYRHGATPRITMHLRSGDTRLLPVRRDAGQLAIDLGPTPADEVQRIDVEWPSKRLEDVTLIDTPGIASLSAAVSARSAAFLTPADSPSEADAIIYLMRHLHTADLGFLSAFHDTSVGTSSTVNAMAVLSRADEIGAGRIDALLSARTIAERYRTDGALRSLALDVVPIAGLLGQSARTLRQREFDALRQVARLGREARERLLVSVDRFVRADAGIEVSAEDRELLLERFGLFGIRMSAVAIRSGFDDSTELADELYRRSGMEELLRLVSDQFRSRSDALKARAALAAIRTLLDRRPTRHGPELASAVERLEANAHELRELAALSNARTVGLSLPRADAAEAERLIGGSGTSSARRLGLPDGASPDELRTAATDALRRWRGMVGSPLLDRAALEASQVVIRSCEALVMGVAPSSVERRHLRLVLHPEPAVGRRDDAQHPGDDGEREAGQDQ
ncbi:GTP-binding protein [Agromyces badenianii]|uniref:GTP-binding protein n=1 Tax=Agromyces badenianii TaxID=2080742 RepID=A0A2S0WVA4_9MICO|nr:dynamin family protein [Agromyces badenianii]AWB95228.1 GTP-binding protein [Agromyces badenianii]